MKVSLYALVLLSPIHFCILCFCGFFKSMRMCVGFLETNSSCVTRLAICLSRPLTCWDYRDVYHTQLSLEFQLFICKVIVVAELGSVTFSLLSCSSFYWPFLYSGLFILRYPFHFYLIFSISLRYL